MANGLRVRGDWVSCDLVANGLRASLCDSVCVHLCVLAGWRRWSLQKAQCLQRRCSVG